MKTSKEGYGIAIRKRSYAGRNDMSEGQLCVPAHKPKDENW